MLGNFAIRLYPSYDFASCSNMHNMLILGLYRITITDIYLIRIPIPILKVQGTKKVEVRLQPAEVSVYAAGSS